MKHIKLFENFDTNSIDEICKKFKIENYTINDEGSIDVEGRVFLYGRNLKEIPLKFNKINGDFDISHNTLSNLYNSPKYITGNFNCSNNSILTSLEGAPISCNLFACTNTILQSLEGMGTDYNNINLCANNIKNLKGIQSHIKGFLYLSYNKNLKLLEYFPTVDGVIELQDCPIDVLYKILNSTNSFYDVLNEFNNFNIMSNLEDYQPTIYMKRFGRFLDLYDLYDITNEQHELLKRHYKLLRDDF